MQLRFPPLFSGWSPPLTIGCGTAHQPGQQLAPLDCSTSLTERFWMHLDLLQDSKRFQSISKPTVNDSMGGKVLQ